MVMRVPPCRRNSVKPPSNTATKGLGLNCSATAETSCSRCALRKARTKRPLCTRARRTRLHFERMIAQEITLKINRDKRTTFATGPVCPIRSTISPPTTAARGKGKCILFGGSGNYRRTSSASWRGVSHPLTGFHCRASGKFGMRSNAVPLCNFVSFVVDDVKKLEPQRTRRYTKEECPTRHGCPCLDSKLLRSKT